MEKEETEFRALFASYLSWKESQQSQTDGYEYERSFVEFTRSMNKQLFEMSVRDENEEKNSRKKKFKPV
jgi:uncharacterized protein YbcC (UPF0753/DUF2309 family)